MFAQIYIKRSVMVYVLPSTIELYGMIPDQSARRW